MAHAPSSRRRLISEYAPGCTLRSVNHGVQKVILQVFGLLGNGKSSLINSCLCVLHGGGYRNQAFSAADCGGVTMKRTEYPLTSTVALIDNRGLNKLSAVEQLESSAQFRFLRDLGKVTWTGISLREASRLCNEEQRGQPVHLMVPVFVQRCGNIWNKHEGKDVERLLAAAYSSTGIRPIIVITHLSSGNPRDLIEKFKTFGSLNFFLLENYTTDNHEPNPETESAIVEFLYTCLMEAECRIQSMAGEDLTARRVKQATEQLEEEAKVMKRSVDRLSEVLKKF